MSEPTEAAIIWHEYAVLFHNPTDEGLGHVHRGPMSEEAALDWIARIESGGATPGAFVLGSRVVSDWAPASNGSSDHEEKT